MPLITSIPVHSVKSLAGLRNKISFIACELGIPAIRASRLSAACSETVRHILKQNISPTVSISLSSKESGQLTIMFSPWVDTNNGQFQTSPLVDTIQRGKSSLTYCQHLDANVEAGNEYCERLRDKMQRMVMPTRADLEIQATHDALTHLFNRYALEECFNAEIERARRYRFPISLLMMDIDLFKQVNDNYGHQAGDACLVALGSMIRSVSREQDIAARFGGEEFVLVLPHTPPDKAFHLAERFRKSIESTPVEYGGEIIGFTVSIGICGFEQATEISRKQLLETADQALYEAKETGRNRVCVKHVK